MAVTDHPAWQELRLQREAFGRTTLRELFATDPGRVDRLTFEAAGVHADLSKNLVTDGVTRALVELARATGVPESRDAMFRGEWVNTTEGRPALHVALRMPRERSVIVEGHDVVRDVHETLDRMERIATQVADGSARGATGSRFRTVVNVGIGGSDLGPVMTHEALGPRVDSALRFRFISDLDGSGVVEATRGLDPAETLIVVCSKTFTTRETLENARALRAWLVGALGEDAVASHFVAVTSDADSAGRFGIATDRVLALPDWVGGRHSLPGAVGLSTMLEIGPAAFRAFLAGMHRMDEHFREAPAATNLPLVLGLLGVWYRNFFGAQTLAVLPYDRHLSRFPAYLGQLAMESNGKSATAEGEPVEVETAPIVWGESGTNGQHSFHQLLHQGTALVPCDLIGFFRPVHEGTQPQRDLLNANLFAQSAALAFGLTAEELADDGVALSEIPHRVMPGNRPSTVLLLDQLDPAALGSLIALYEHGVFTQATVWGINPFDQWGVEHGKRLADTIADDLASVDDPALGHDPSTDALIRRVRSSR